MPDVIETQSEKCASKSANIYIGVISNIGQNYAFDFRVAIPVSISEDDDSYGSSYDFSLDLAPYHINENTTAIGLRTSSSVGYSGGGAGRESLRLFFPEEKQLFEVLQINVLLYEIIAGDWNSDGSRNHHGDHDKSTLHVLKTKTNGFYDFLVKTTRHEYEGKQLKKSVINTLYVWSEEKKKYVPKSNP
jgi:hypothetical protein